MIKNCRDPWAVAYTFEQVNSVCGVKTTCEMIPNLVCVGRQSKLQKQATSFTNFEHKKIVSRRATWVSKIPDLTELYKLRHTLVYIDFPQR